MSRFLKHCNAHSGRCTFACNKHLASLVVFLQIHTYILYTAKFPLRIETKFCCSCLKVPLHALKFSQSNADGFPFPDHSGTYVFYDFR